MVRRLRLGLSLFPLLLLVAPASADEEFESLWSATLLGEFKAMSGQEARDEITGFFDRYEFTPNKSSSFPLELGVRDASFDWMGEGDTPRLQLRLASPTSNLGVSGSQIDQPFLNQRADLFGRFSGLDFDVDYRRMRTEELRLYPGASTTVGPAFSDRTSPVDRFDHDRTGFGGELRLSPLDLLGRERGGLGGLIPDLALRGGYEARDGLRQNRFLLNPSNDWIALSQPLDQTVAKAGGGLFLAPGGLFTLGLDFDHKRFREDGRTTLQSDLGPPFPAGSRTIGFIPDTDLSTGTLRLLSRLGERAVIDGGFQLAQLEQTDDRTPLQLAAGLTDNKVRFYSANVGADLAILDRLSANAFFKFDRRDNDIQRNTSLFNQANQIGVFYDEWTRMSAGVEAVFRPRRYSLLAVGARYEAIDRTLDFALPIPGNQFIPQNNANVADETRMYTLYGRTRISPLKGLGIRGEVGYRGAPETGYIVDLDKYIYGKLHLSYALPIRHPVVISAFGQGGSGENRDFTAVGATSAASRDFDRHEYVWGLTVHTSAGERASVFASFFQSRDAQDYDLVTSTVQRYFPGAEFAFAGSTGYQNDQMNLTVGSQIQLARRTDGGISYSFTRVEDAYHPEVPSRELGLIMSGGEIDADIHGFDFELGHWLKDGLRVLVGYRLQLHTDRVPVPAGVGSVVAPFDLSMTQHAVRVGVTLTSDLLAKSKSDE